ncbi:hypothetical protein KOW79_009377 [Hemibagrus wyckioides]|uniref:Uncharacterized protein n=1 Tax=Hemibagrus wyckioides TaxID=337641 RepID=A0A9D3SKC8_9TELE|nr:hypothetical protein KOW79_009377 [Hemibagrus wyckioides]
MIMPEKYRRILPVKSLSEVENPWKGISLNRCILVALVIVVLCSGVEMVQEKIEPIFEVVGDTDEFEKGWWDNLALWKWGEEEEMDQFSKNRAAMQPGEKPRKREMPGKLLKGRN